jgi:hypothetical protein
MAKGSGSFAIHVNSSYQTHQMIESSYGSGTPTIRSSNADVTSTGAVSVPHGASTLHAGISVICMDLQGVGIPSAHIERPWENFMYASVQDAHVQGVNATQTLLPLLTPLLGCHPLPPAVKTFIGSCKS